MRPNAGYTLTEAALYLAIVGLVMGGIWLGVASIIHQRQSQRAISQIIGIREGIRGLYASNAMQNCGHWDDCPITEVAIKAAVLPSDMLVGTDDGKGNTGIDYNRATSPWGGYVYLKYAQFWFENGSNRMSYDAIFINYDPVSSDICTKIANQLIFDKQDVLYYSIDKSTGNIPPPYGLGPTLTPDLAAQMCHLNSPTALQILYRL